MSASLSQLPPAKRPLVTCDGHGRLPWMGHVECATCGAQFRKQPKVCHGYIVDPRTRMAHRCTSTVFRAECAKCYASDSRSTAAASSFEERGELGSAGYE